MSIRFIRTDDGQQWDAFVAATPGATDFHSWSWLKLQVDLFGWGFVPLLVAQNDKTIGVFPVLMRSKGSPRSALIPFPFVGPLVPEHLLLHTLRGFRRWQLRAGLPFVRFEFPPSLGEAAKSALTSAGCDWHEDRTFVIDLTHGSTEKLWSGLNQNARRSIRAAQRNGVEVRPSRVGEVSELLPRVLSEAYEARGIPSPYPAEVGRALEKWCATQENVYCRTALVHGKPVGVYIALGGQPIALAWAGGCLREHRSANPNTVLYYDMLCWALGNGNTAFDLVGRVDDGVSRFKMSLGGLPQPYVTAVSSRVPVIVLDIAQRLRHARAAGEVAAAGEVSAAVNVGAAGNVDSRDTTALP